MMWTCGQLAWWVLKPGFHRACEWFDALPQHMAIAIAAGVFGLLIIVDSDRAEARVICTAGVMYGFEPAWDDPSSDEFAGPCRCGAREECSGCGEMHTLIMRCAPCAAVGQESLFRSCA